MSRGDFQEENHNRYKDMFSKIEVPQELRAKTLEQISTLERKPPVPETSVPRTGKRKPSSAVRRGLLSAAAVIVLAVGVRFVFFAPSVIRTDLNAGHTEQVDLRDGHMEFSKLSAKDAEEFEHRWGSKTVTKKTWSLKKYEKYLKKKLDIPAEINKVKLGDESVTAYFDEAHKLLAVSCEAAYTAQEDLVLKLTVSESEEGLSVPVSKGGFASEIKGVPLQVTYIENENKYAAVWKQDGLYYELSALNIKQKDFIEFVYPFFED